MYKKANKIKKRVDKSNGMTGNQKILNKTKMVNIKTTIKRFSIQNRKNFEGKSENKR